MRKTNCWEFKKCGREPYGNRIDEFGVCPAATERMLDLTHDGHNAGRACWVVAGTLCSNKVQGTFARKFDTCEKCDFYITVKREEAPMFILSAELLRRLRGSDIVSRANMALQR